MKWPSEIKEIKRQTNKSNKIGTLANRLSLKNYWDDSKVGIKK